MGSSIKNLPSIIYYELMKNYDYAPYVPASIQVKDVSVYAFASALIFTCLSKAAISPTTVVALLV